jgi:hypothetical protein
MTVIAEARDRDGRGVVLDEHGWAHILEEHGEMATHRDAVIATVNAPPLSPTRPSAHPRALLPSRAGPQPLAVGSHSFSQDPARVVTAYGNRKDPPGWTP